MMAHSESERATKATAKQKLRQTNWITQYMCATTFAYEIFRAILFVYVIPLPELINVLVEKVACESCEQKHKSKKKSLIAKIATKFSWIVGNYWEI